MTAKVLAVSQYEFTDKETGDKLSGSKVILDRGQTVNEENRKGLDILELGGDKSLFAALKPGELYEFGFTVNKSGKMRLTSAKPAMNGK